MNRRFFHRADVKANGELLWATRSLIGRVSNHRAHVTTINISIDGAKIAIPGKHAFPKGAKASLKLGIEFCEVEVLESQSMQSPQSTMLRLNFLNPSARFVATVEKWLPISTDGREDFVAAWT